MTPTTQHYWNNIEVREEGGTPQIIGSIRAGLTIQLKEKIGSHQTEAIELACSKKVIEQWRDIPEVIISRVLILHWWYLFIVNEYIYINFTFLPL